MEKKLISPNHLGVMSGANLRMPDIFLTTSPTTRGMMPGTSGIRKPLNERGKATLPTLDTLGSTMEHSSSWSHSARKS